jgi:hypothetical protein
MRLLVCGSMCVDTQQAPSHVPQGLCGCFSFDTCVPVFTTFLFSGVVRALCTLSSLLPSHTLSHLLLLRTRMRFGCAGVDGCESDRVSPSSPTGSSTLPTMP